MTIVIIKSMLDYNDRHSKPPIMANTSTEPRQRLVLAAADMLRRRGLNATSVREVAKLAQAPLGSTYHYFPDGKPQLIHEAVAFSGAQVHGVLARELANGPHAGLRAFLALWRQRLADSDYRAGCPVMAVAADDGASDDDAQPLAAAAAAIDSWRRLLADSLRHAGVATQRAERLATMMIAAVEGAILLCRAQHGPTPLDEVAQELDDLLASVLPAA